MDLIFERERDGTRVKNHREHHLLRVNLQNFVFSSFVGRVQILFPNTKISNVCSHCNKPGAHVHMDYPVERKFFGSLRLQKSTVQQL